MLHGDRHSFFTKLHTSSKDHEDCLPNLFTQGNGHLNINTSYPTRKEEHKFEYSVVKHGKEIRKILKKATINLRLMHISFISLSIKIERER